MSGSAPTVELIERDRHPYLRLIVDGTEIDYASIREFFPADLIEVEMPDGSHVEYIVTHRSKG